MSLIGKANVLPVGTIAGIVIGAIIVAALAIVAIMVVWSKLRTPNQTPQIMAPYQPKEAPTPTAEYTNNALWSATYPSS